MKNRKSSGTDEKKRFKMRDNNWQTELDDSRKAAASVAHLVVCAASVKDSFNAERDFKVSGEPCW